MSSTALLPPQTRRARRARHEAAPAINSRGYQPEVQGIRALAVGLVLSYHYWPTKVTGGFIGVDIFFVVSGFLISSHMYREAASTGGIKLGRFWARRVRRLLPISLLVLLVSLLATMAVLPKTIWATTFKQIAASAMYTQNWILASDAVDYSAKDNAATVVQHYWSLSVEEQFYLVWPIVFIAAIGISLAVRRRRSSGTLARRGYVAILIALASLFVASLAYSVVATHADSATAYFVTPTRVWEFAAGSLVALTFLGRQLVGPRSTLLAWAALGTILLCAFEFSASTPFPGWVALFPVAGTCLLLSAPGSYSWTSPRWWLSSRPMTFLGDISYGIYLWHWPMIVLARSFYRGEPTLAIKVVIIALTIAVASASKKYIEDPWRNGRVIGTTKRSMAFAVVGTLAIAVGAFALTPRIDASAASTVASQAGKPCFGPAALAPGAHCASVMGAGKPMASPEAVIAENTTSPYPHCQSVTEGTEVLNCGFGADQTTADRTVAIVGDSHASQWFSAMDQLGKTRNWHIKAFTKTGCPVTFAVRDNGSKTPQSGAECIKYTGNVVDRIVKDDSISVVFVANRAEAYGYSSGQDPTLATPSVDGYAKVWGAILDASKQVVVLGEVPFLGVVVPTCLAQNVSTPLACSRSAALAVPKTLILAKVADTLKDRGVLYMPMRDFFCDQSTCYPIIGGLITYRDSSHITNEYSNAMAPSIGRFLDDAGLGPLAE